MQIIPFILATLLGVASLLPGIGSRAGDANSIATGKSQSPISENGYLWQCAPDEAADCAY